jgi:hypothetical protein
MSSDGRWVVTASSDDTARVWNVAPGDDVEPEGIGAARLKALAQLLAARQVDATGAVVPLDASELFAAWNAVANARPSPH